MAWLDRLLRRSSDAAGTASGVDASDAQVVEIELFDGAGWRVAQLDVRAPRVSDAINEPDAGLNPRLPDGTPVSLDDVHLVIPPEHPSGDPARRLHRPTHQLWVRIGESSVTGNLHLPPGSAGSAYVLRRSHQYFVLTDAVIIRPVPDGREERRVPVAFVNLLHVSSLRDSPEPERPATMGEPA